MQTLLTRFSITLILTVLPFTQGTAQEHIHPHDHHSGPSKDGGHNEETHHHAEGTATGNFLTIDDILSLEQNRGVAASGEHGNRPSISSKTSGNGILTFEVQVRSEALPKRVFEQNPFTKGKRTILNCAHGGFAYDYRTDKGEVYWFLQGAGIIRVNRNRSSIELLDTDSGMVKFNMHNATFFVHDKKPMIAWPANGGGKVFVTDLEGQVLQTIGKPSMKPYSDGAAYKPTDTAYLDGKLWVTDGYASKYVMSFDLSAKKWTGTIFGGHSKKIEPGKFGTNHGITIHKGLIYIAGRYFARIHEYEPNTDFVKMFPLPDGSKPCDFEFFTSNKKLYGVACSLNTSNGNKKKGDKGAAIYIVDMKTLKIVSTIKPKDELGLTKFSHLHNVFPCVDNGTVTLFCQAWNGGDFAILRQVVETKKTDKSK